MSNSNEKIQIIDETNLRVNPLQEKIDEAKKILASNISVLYDRNQNIDIIAERSTRVNDAVIETIKNFHFIAQSFFKQLRLKYSNLNHYVTEFQNFLRARNSKL